MYNYFIIRKRLTFSQKIFLKFELKYLLALAFKRKLKAKSEYFYIVKTSMLLFWLFLSIDSFSQIDKNSIDSIKSFQKILIGGRVEEDYHKLSDVVISLSRNGKCLKKIVTNENGDFLFQLQPENEYFIEINKDGYASKKLYISTYEMPDNIDINWTTGIVVDLFKNDQSLNVSILRNPIGKIYYYPDKKTLDYDRDYTKSIQDELDSLQTQLNKIRTELKRIDEKRIQEEKRKQREQEEEQERIRKEEELKTRVMAQNLERQKKNDKTRRDSTYRANKAQQISDSKKRFAQEQLEKQKIEKNLRLKNDSLMRERLVIKKLEEDKQQKAMLAIAERKKQELDSKNRIDSLRLAQTREAQQKLQKETLQALNKTKEVNSAYDVFDDRIRINIAALKGVNPSDTVVKIQYFNSDNSSANEETAKANFNRKMSSEEKKEFFAMLVRNYPPGVSLEEDIYPNFKIKRIIAVQDKTSCEYKIIEFNFGVFFKRNEFDMTKPNFKHEVAGFDSYFTK